MTETEIFAKLFDKQINNHYTIKYINFIKNVKAHNKLNLTGCEYVENHHILPKSVFPEFKNLKIHKWNSITLTGRQHFIAHIMLGLCLGGNMWNSIHRMSKQCNIYLFSKKYEIFRKMASAGSKNKKWFSKDDTTIFAISPPDNTWENKRIVQDGSGTKNKCVITNINTNEIRFINPSESVPIGWIIGNYQKRNTIVISSLDGLQTRQIQKNTEIPEGWCTGAPKSATWRIINPITLDEKYVKSKTDIPEGWILHNKKINSTWYINPETNESKLIYDTDIPPINWVPGSKFQNGIYRTRNRKWYHMNGKSKMYYPNNVPDGWELGRY